MISWSDDGGEDGEGDGEGEGKGTANGLQEIVINRPGQKYFTLQG